MKIAKREDFSLIFMSILAKNISKEYISLTSIAKQTHLSPLFLKHIASVLLKHRLVESREGISGGYKLARNPKSISIAEIIEAISPRVVTPSCFASRCRIKRDSCSCSKLWEKVNKRISNILQNISLSEFVNL